MSYEDYEFGSKRLLTSTRYVTVDNAASTPLCGASANRVGLRFSAPVANRVTITDNGPAVLDAGLNIPPAVMHGSEFCAKTTGNQCKKAWNGIAATAAQVIAVMETIIID